MLATIGATAPSSACSARCGRHHALVAIGMSGSGMLDKVAGPVGRLIMTGMAWRRPAGGHGHNWLTCSTAC
jgi:biopolymer transport protein ExbB